MPTTVQFRRGTTAQNNAFTGANGEISVDTDDGRLVVHDGSTAGGTRQALASETIFRVVADDSTGIYLQGGTDELRISGGNGISTSTDSGGSLTVSLDTSDSATFNGGVIVDNITIDGTEIDLSSGDLTLDVAGDIILDANGDEIIFKDGTTNVGHVSMDSDNLTIKSLVSDKDIILQGNDGGSPITALTLDMSAAGAAAFNSTVTATGFTIGSAAINEADLEQIDDLTAGTITASKAVVVDSNKDVSSFRNLTATGTITTAILDVNSIKSTDSTHIRIDEGLDVVGTLKVQEITSLDSSDVLITNLRVQSIVGDDSSVVNFNEPVNVNGSVTASSSFIIGSADLNESDLEQLDGLTAGTVTASKAVVVDGSKNIGDFGSVTATSFVIGSADINEADLEQIDGLTAGTVTASKAVVVDSDKDISSFRNLTATGTVTTANLAATGNIQVDGNLTVSGTTTSVNTTNLEIQDALLELSKNNSGGADVDAGIFIQRGSAGNNAVFYWNEGDDKFKAVLSNSVATATAVTDSSTATIFANFEGDTLQINEISSGDSSFVNINDGLNVDGNIQTTSGNITAGGSFIIGSADMDETDLEKLDGITNGTVAGNKAVVVDGSKNIGDFGSVTATSFVIGSADINESDLEQIDGLTAGTITASKAVVVDANKDAGDFRNVTLTGTLHCTTLDVREIESTDSTNITVNEGLEVLGTLQVNEIVSSDSSEVTINNLRTQVITANDSTEILVNDAMRVSGLITGTATQAQYADLAEIFPTDDTDLEPGDVVHFSGDNKVSKCDHDAHTAVAGVISTEPGFLLNEGGAGVKLAMTGKVPCKVQGVVNPGDLMVSAGNGKARAESSPAVGTVIGKAIESHTSDGDGVINIMVVLM